MWGRRRRRNNAAISRTGVVTVAALTGSPPGRYRTVWLPSRTRNRVSYTQRWQAVQAEFVDRPGPALDEADQLVTEVMRDCGYPVEDFSERAELVAADHPQVMEHYRAAHAIQHTHHGNSGSSDTEELRQAFVHYRALFNELVHAQ